MEIVRYLEVLNNDELAFLQRKERKDRHHFFRTVQIIMVVCFVIPFIIAWMSALSGKPNAFSYGRYFLGVGYLLCFAGACIYLSYYYFLRKIRRDIRVHTKTIERAHITEKKFMPQTDTYYFYLDSPTKLSIEVTGDDFHRLSAGDEVNIEYTTHSKMYLGYF